MTDSGTAEWPPRGLNGWLVRRFAPDVGDPRKADARARLGLVQGWLGVGVNFVLFVLKAAIGLMLGSIALVADACDSLSDVAASGVIILGCTWSRRPRDAQHPFGHGRVELVASLVTAIMLIVVGLALAKESIVRVLHPPSYVAPWWVVGVIALTIPVKEWLAGFSRTLSRASASSLIEAGYWHLRFDTLMASLVCLALISSRMGWGSIDAWVGLIIAGLILHAGVALVRERISPLVGEAPSPEDLQLIERAALGLDGVRSVHDIIVHKYGDLHLVSFHIEVDATRPIMDLHDLCERVEDAVEKATGAKAVVHMDPVDRSHPDYARSERVVAACVRDDGAIRAFHDLRVKGKRSDLVVTVDIVAHPEVAESVYEEICGRVTACLRSELGERAQIAVSVESAFDGA